MKKYLNILAGVAMFAASVGAQAVPVPVTISLTNVNVDTSTTDDITYLGNPGMHIYPIDQNTYFCNRIDLKQSNTGFNAVALTFQSLRAQRTRISLSYDGLTCEVTNIGFIL